MTLKIYKKYKILIIFLQERVIHFHVLAPNAGEITEGYALGMRLGAKKHKFDITVEIHPTCSKVKFYFIFLS
jgi:thioredoxin reductase (NADPH)